MAANSESRPVDTVEARAENPAEAPAERPGAFAERLGIVLKEASAAEALLLLRLSGEVLNPTGEVHPGAIFTLAESAAAALALLAFEPGQMTFSSKKAEIRYRRPAREDLWARAWLSHELLTETRARALSEGKVDVPISIEITVAAGERIAEATVILGLRRL